MVFPRTISIVFHITKLSIYATQQACTTQVLSLRRELYFHIQCSVGHESIYNVCCAETTTSLSSNHYVLTVLLHKQSSLCIQSVFCFSKAIVLYPAVVRVLHAKLIRYYILSVHIERQKFSALSAEYSSDAVVAHNKRIVVLRNRNLLIFSLRHNVCRHRLTSSQLNLLLCHAMTGFCPISRILQANIHVQHHFFSVGFQLLHINILQTENHVFRSFRRNIGQRQTVN